ncbi:peptidylprolyl isomerase [Glaciecola petra]|uniref:Peptidyl-prolyl cis-trans isomerase n=1 Tax=Glaciecola petra TaxID=3075602 RepID=A0ABU2ZTH0_9ALTE|nr:peptidylprolyl isomerase [Aestuariibacter sp. P117]MDT0594697.1 peptidylprolyl isomerase [Aestuariibacter sp. P117]
MKNNLLLGFCLLTLSLSVSHIVKATVVEVRTVVGDFQVNLFDDVTPQTVNNFLDYVNSGAYANNVVHRSVPGFVVQMGGFTYNNAFPLDEVATGAPVVNEPELSNLRGTIAMAKLSGNPDSATSQFFVNLENNATVLDPQNGGFSVFGQVLGNGMEVVDAIANLSRFNFGGALAELPLRDYSTTDATNNVVPNDDNFVIITDIVVIDATRVTNSDLNPASNTLIDSSSEQPTNPDGGDSSGGGSINIVLLIGLALIIRLRYLRKTN